MPLKWRKTWISDETFEAAGVFDVDGDGVRTLSPAFYKSGFQGFICRCAPGNHDDFSVIPMDVAGKGRLDFITGGWWGNTLRWRENPGDPAAQWPEHVIATTGNIETTRAWDVDGDGRMEIIPNTPGRREVTVFKLRVDSAGKGTGKFDEHVVFTFPEGEKQGHGLGCGDIGQWPDGYCLHGGNRGAC